MTPKNRKIKLSYGNRDDFTNKEESNIVSQTGELKVEQSNHSGWNGILHLIRRNVVSYAENPDLDYILGDLRMSYGQRSSSINWEGFFRLEESLTEVSVLDNIPPVQDSTTEIVNFFLINLFIIFLVSNFINLTT